ncbi:hypothetical protein [Sphingomonas sp. ACRSK]|uniref:hypothetical protein n=1 Tax=Sphingomonas sp. ACRSK TaxID=2918213 RepID=UPI001EF60226|nr:hypothetical protein [Sphingomonas sp. ACRSK]MCG7349508.1 hypothetical protein [Sphingomonas sp. ACRSK]
MLLPLVLLLATAQEAVPTRFYNRPGASSAELAAELRRCRTITTGTHGGEGRALTPPNAPVLHRAPARSLTIEDCMVTRGWRLYAIKDTQRLMLGNLDTHARAEAFARLVGAKCPRDALLRQELGTRLRR